MIYRLIRYCLIVYIKVVLFAKVEGIENIPRKGGVLLCANHKSNFDPILIASFIPWKIRYMAKEELFKVPLYAAFMRFVGAFPVRRGRVDATAVKKAIDLLKDGSTMLIFPQGTRKKDIKPEDFKRGTPMIATRSGATIVPIGISGKYTVFGRPRVIFGKPIEIAQYIPEDDGSDKEYLDTISAMLYEKIKELTKP